MFLSEYVETLLDCSVPQVDHEYTTIIDLHAYSREMIGITADLTKILTLAFLQML